MSKELKCSREHLNRLLQQGLDIPIDGESLITDYSAGAYPEMPICTVCLISVGETPLEAAQHYRSREHVNKRLQKGLPVATGPAGAGSAPADNDDDTEQRDYINECLRLGIPNPYALKTDSFIAPVRPKISSGKRKFPVPSIGNAPPGTLAAPISGFGGKRVCRPISSLQKNPSDFQNSNSLGIGFQGNPPRSQSGQAFRPPFLRTHAPVARATRPVAPSANQWNLPVTAPAREPFYKDQFFGTSHLGDSHNVANAFADQYQDQSGVLYAAQKNVQMYNDHQGSVLFGAAQNTIYNENNGSSFTEGWFCDLCNKALPTAAALNQQVCPSVIENWSIAPTQVQPSIELQPGGQQALGAFLRCSSPGESGSEFVN